MDKAERTINKFKAWATPAYCIVCGQRSRYITRNGAEVCEEHSLSDISRDEPIYDWRTGEKI